MSETAPTPGPDWPSHWKQVVLTRFRPIRPESSSQTNIADAQENKENKESKENINNQNEVGGTRHQNRQPESNKGPSLGYIDIDEDSLSDIEDDLIETIEPQTGGRDMRTPGVQLEADESSGYQGHTDLDEINISDLEDDINNDMQMYNGGRETRLPVRQPEAEWNSGYQAHTDVDQMNISDIEDDIVETSEPQKEGRDTRLRIWQLVADENLGYPIHTHVGQVNISDIKDDIPDNADFQKGGIDTGRPTWQPESDENTAYLAHTDMDQESKTPTVEKESCQVDTSSGEVDVEVQDATNDKDDDDLYDRGPCSRGVENIEKFLARHYSRYNHYIIAGVKVVLFLAYLVYFSYCCYYRYYDEGSYILTAITGLIIIKLVNDKIVSRCIPKEGCTCVLVKYGTSGYMKHLRQFLRYGLYLTSLAAVSVYLGLDVLSTHPQNAQALIGVAALILFCFLFSFKPSRVNWHPVFWGFIIQIVFAILTLRTWAGFQAFKWIGDLIFRFVRLSDKGSAFVFGDTFRHDIAGFFIDSAGVIVFFNACIFVLDNWGVLEFIVLKIGRGLAFCLETGPVESVVAAANIFIGLSEAPLIVRPYLPTVTRSELHAIMTCGFSSISGAFMAMFIKAGAPANHLLTASVISAPAGLAISKLMYPEVETVNYASQRDVKMRDNSEAQKNVLQACSDGAAFSIKLIGSIMVNMLAFVSLMNLIDSLLVWAGDRAGVDNMTFDFICSYVLWPLSYVMGVPSDDCGKVGSLIGVKMMATPFVAYRDLGNVIKNRLVLQKYLSTGNGTWHWAGKNIILDTVNTTLVGGVLSERAEVIATYALCGISAFPAIGFSMGTLIPMCPPRKRDVIDVVIRAFIAGNLANFATGTIAGVMFTPNHES